MRGLNMQFLENSLHQVRHTTYLSGQVRQEVGERECGNQLSRPQPSLSYYIQLLDRFSLICRPFAFMERVRGRDTWKELSRK